MSSDGGLAPTWRRWSAVGSQLQDPAKDFRKLLVLFVASLVLHGILSMILPFAEDELYYWTWSKTLSASYYDHPPMIAWAIRLGTAIFGDNAFGIRFVPSLFATGAVFLLARILPTVLPVALLLLTPAFFFGGVFATPDLPLAFFWAGYLSWLAGACRRLDEWERDPMQRAFSQSPLGWLTWIVGGLWLGLGGLSKYTMVLAVPCTLITLLIWFQKRSWLLGFLLHGVVAGAIASVILLFSHGHGWAPLLFQWTHAFGGGGARFGDFLLGQLALFGALAPMGIAVVLWYGGRLASEPSLRPALVFFLLPTLFFFGKAMRSPLEANWPLVAYLGALPLFSRWPQLSSFPLGARTARFLSFLPALVVSAALLVHIVTPIPLVPVPKDRLRTLQAKYASLEKIAQYLKEHAGSTPVFAQKYQLVSYLRYFGIAANQPAGIARDSQFTLERINPCNGDSMYYVQPEGDDFPSALSCFSTREVAFDSPEMVGAKPVGMWRLWHATKASADK